jgi:hypothetical protein
MQNDRRHSFHPPNFISAIDDLIDFYISWFSVAFVNGLTHLGRKPSFTIQEVGTIQYPFICRMIFQNLNLNIGSRVGGRIIERETVATSVYQS